MAAARWLVAIASLAGCRQILGFDEPVRGGAADSATIDQAAPKDGANCFGSSPEDRICLVAPPSGDISLTMSMLDTETSPSCAARDASGPAGCVLAGTNVTINTIVAKGSLPVIVVATNTITIASLLDVSSHRGLSSGAGFTNMGCMVVPVPPAFGGGPGGSFGSIGGNGGNDSSGLHGGSAAPAVMPMTLRGGCSGTGGGPATCTSIEGTGGGAVLLIASSIVINGAVNASGAGGTSDSNTECGGGGGGSGGMIALDAPSISGTGTLLANGGGGASGSKPGGAMNGSDPTVSSPLAPAAGGVGPNGGSGGGAGAAGTSAATNGQNGACGNCGGGGGGGGGGVIRFYQARFTTGTVSP